MAISSRLIDRLAATVDRATLKAQGTAEISLDSSPDAPKMTMFRVARCGEHVTVPRGQLRIVYSGLSRMKTAE